MNYKELLNTKEWLIRRLLILNRDNFKCTNCQSTINITVHHKGYIKDRLPHEYPDEALTTLCSKCHTDIHNKIPIGDFYLNKYKKYSLPKDLMKLIDKYSGK